MTELINIVKHHSCSIMQTHDGLGKRGLKPCSRVKLVEVRIKMNGRSMHFCFCNTYIVFMIVLHHVDGDARSLSGDILGVHSSAII